MFGTLATCLFDTLAALCVELDSRWLTEDESLIPFPLQLQADTTFFPNQIWLGSNAVCVRSFPAIGTASERRGSPSDIVQKLATLGIGQPTFQRSRTRPIWLHLVKHNLLAWHTK